MNLWPLAINYNSPFLLDDEWLNQIWLSEAGFLGLWFFLRFYSVSDMFWEAYVDQVEL